jgi:tRNA(Ile)-lysidine synthase
MAALDPNVAAVRAAVRDGLDAGPGAVLVACSGGADSLALAAAVAFVAPRRGVRAGLVTVDHGLQPGSAERAAALVDWAGKEGLTPAIVETVSVAGRPGGPEAAAREARYQALVGAARRCDAATVLLGHTLEDQAETVLLALVRGAGLRGLAGMPAVREVDGVRLVRPLLGLSRAQTRAACAALGITAWRDPHNEDPSYARTHARALLSSYVDSLGPAVVGNLARTARLAAADAEALDEVAGSARAAATDGDGGLRIDVLAGLAPAVRGRVLHGWVRSLGVPGSALSHRHVAALDALVVGWHGQGPVHLPGAVVVARRAGRLRIERITTAGHADGGVWPA